MTDSRRPDPLTSGDERTMLRSLLDWYRAGVIEKVQDLTDEQLSHRFVPSSSTIGGLVKHLALVEDHWWYRIVPGAVESEPWASAPWDTDPDWEFHSAADDSLDTLLDLYRTACDRGRAVEAAVPDLDVVAARPNGLGHPFTVRWAMLHLIEETARHLGHLDILRELADGTTGE